MLAYDASTITSLHGSLIRCPVVEISVMIITMLIMVSVLKFTLSVGERSNAVLLRAKDDLENRVDDRTMELQ